MGTNKAARRKKRDASNGMTVDSSDESHASGQDARPQPRRRNTSSDEELDEPGSTLAHRNMPTNDPNPTSTAVTVNDPRAATLSTALESLGHMSLSSSGGAELALAATQSNNPAEVMTFLTASCFANGQVTDRANSNAASALTRASLAHEGVGNADATFENRYNQQKEVIAELSGRVDTMQSQLVSQQALLRHVIAQLLHVPDDANEVTQMMANFNL